MDVDVGLNKCSKQWKGELGTEVQSVEGVVEWEESEGGAEGSCYRSDLFLGLLVRKAIGEGESNDIKAKENPTHTSYPNYIPKS